MHQILKTLLFLLKTSLWKQRRHFTYLKRKRLLEGTLVFSEKTLKVNHLRIENLKRRAFHLRQKIDSARGNKEVIREYVQILWKLCT